MQKVAKGGRTKRDMTYTGNYIVLFWLKHLLQKVEASSYTIHLIKTLLLTAGHKRCGNSLPGWPNHSIRYSWHSLHCQNYAKLRCKVHPGLSPKEPREERFLNHKTSIIAQTSQVVLLDWLRPCQCQCANMVII